MNNKEYNLSDAIDVIEEILNGGGEFRMFPKGTSMLPLIKQKKDSVVIIKKNISDIKKHDIVFYRRDNGQFVLHRIMKCCKDGSYTMCGDNQFVMEKNIRPEQIIGCVRKIYKKEHELSLNSFRYKLYVFFWTFLPYRQCIRFPKRLYRFIKRKIVGNK